MARQPRIDVGDQKKENYSQNLSWTFRATTAPGSLRLNRPRNLPPFANQSGKGYPMAGSHGAAGWLSGITLRTRSVSRGRVRMYSTTKAKDGPDSSKTVLNTRGDFSHGALARPKSRPKEQIRWKIQKNPDTTSGRTIPHWLPQ